MKDFLLIIFILIVLASFGTPLKLLSNESKDFNKEMAYNKNINHVLSSKSNGFNYERMAEIPILDVKNWNLAENSWNNLYTKLTQIPNSSKELSGLQQKKMFAQMIEKTKRTLAESETQFFNVLRSVEQLGSVTKNTVGLAKLLSTYHDLSQEKQVIEIPRHEETNNNGQGKVAGDIDPKAKTEVADTTSALISEVHEYWKKQEPVIEMKIEKAFKDLEDWYGAVKQVMSSSIKSLTKNFELSQVEQDRNQKVFTQMPLILAQSQSKFISAIVDTFVDAQKAQQNKVQKHKKSDKLAINPLSKDGAHDKKAHNKKVPKTPKKTNSKKSSKTPPVLSTSAINAIPSTELKAFPPSTTKIAYTAATPPPKTIKGISSQSKAMVPNLLTGLAEQSTGFSPNIIKSRLSEQIG